MSMPKAEPKKEEPKIVEEVKKVEEKKVEPKKEAEVKKVEEPNKEEAEEEEEEVSFKKMSFLISLKGEQMKALFDYSAAEVNELSFKEGDIVTILNRVEGSDWCKARLNGKTGNLVRDVDADF
jgi:archaellum component FlaD/FlaE